LIKILGLVPTARHPQLSVALLDGKAVRCDELYRDYSIQIYSHEFLVDPYNLD